MQVSGQNGGRGKYLLFHADVGNPKENQYSFVKRSIGGYMDFGRIPVSC
jgi:hypothetical protein